MARNWTDEDETQLVGLIFKLLGQDRYLMFIEEAGRKTNVRASDLIEMALMSTGWDMLTDAMNQVDEHEAILEAEEILDAESEHGPSR